MPGAQDPAARNADVEQRRPKRTAEVMPPLGKVHASARKYALRPARRDEIDVKRRKTLFAVPGDTEILPLRGHPSCFHHGLADLHCRLSGQVVVAGARMQELDRL